MYCNRCDDLRESQVHESAQGWGSICADCAAEEAKQALCKGCVEWFDVGELIDGLCEECLPKAQLRTWLDDTETAIDELVRDNGWWIEEAHTAQTGTMYWKVSRGDDVLKIRLADHGVLYEADFSIVYPRNANPDDSTLEALAKRLQ